jgi:formylglycine-generating enzyme required for sulfatase activity
VADWYDAEYYGKSPKENPAGPEKGDKKVIRGGSWSDPPRNLRVTARQKATPDYQDSTIGFRCAMDAAK